MTTHIHSECAPGCGCRGTAPATVYHVTRITRYQDETLYLGHDYAAAVSVAVPMPGSIVSFRARREP